MVPREPGSSRIPSREEPLFLSPEKRRAPGECPDPGSPARIPKRPMNDSHETSSETESTEVRRVQVVARWNSWVHVYDPASGLLQWVNLEEAPYAPA